MKRCVYIYWKEADTTMYQLVPIIDDDHFNELYSISEKINSYGYLFLPDGEELRIHRHNYEKYLLKKKINNEIEQLLTR